MLTCMSGPKLVLFTIVLSSLSTASALCLRFVKGNSWANSIEMRMSPQIYRMRDTCWNPARKFFFFNIFFFFDVDHFLKVFTDFVTILLLQNIVYILVFLAMRHMGS